MGNDDTTFLILNSAFGLGILALLTVAIKYCFRSKCTEFVCCWGLFTIQRNVAAENTELEIENQNQSKAPPQLSPSTPQSPKQQLSKPTSSSTMLLGDDECN